MQSILILVLFFLATAEAVSPKAQVTHRVRRDSSDTSSQDGSNEGLIFAVNTDDPTTETKTDYFYTIPVVVGDTTLHLSINTFASDIMVYEQQPNITLANITLYQPSGGRMKDDKLTWLWTDGLFWACGTTVVRDVLGLGNLSISNQTLAVGNNDKSMPNSFPLGATVKQPWDGMLSLALQGGSSIFSSTDARPQKSWFENIAPLLQAPVVSISLKHQAKGTIDFGGIDETMYTNDIYWTRANTSSMGWMVHIKAYKIQGYDPTVVDWDVAIHTGSTWTWLEHDFVIEYLNVAGLEGAKSDMDDIYYQCNAHLPDLTLTMASIDGKDFDVEIPGATLKAGDYGNGNCSLGLKPWTYNITATPVRIMPFLGISVLRSQYVALNLTGPVVGFAQQVNPTANY
ncbi:aspartic peptidase domain-containing protein [Talaromyces proteolyticus]|uniref:Aspartic peptidase domain-containing protein n=1 Tax=Talaromyces proteolyticus TaxID=1131652 RepID=A0AAD4PYK5_9EURO|nr:aspartic peptidase domain-containing protein [Talaromyces proteolyticus]KAH8701615.1 aspartic peptidase domain-containing protein [Talaromyces proteolyticus]